MGHRSCEKIKEVDYQRTKSFADCTFANKASDGCYDAVIGAGPAVVRGESRGEILRERL